MNRENVDIDDVHNFEMKLGDVIEVTRSRISRYDFEENESVASTEAAFFGSEWFQLQSHVLKEVLLYREKKRRKYNTT